MEIVKRNFRLCMDEQTANDLENLWHGLELTALSDAIRSAVDLASDDLAGNRCDPYQIAEVSGQRRKQRGRPKNHFHFNLDRRTFDRASAIRRRQGLTYTTEAIRLAIRQAWRTFKTGERGR